MYKSLSIIALAGLAASQSLAGLPSCATGCVGNALPANCNLDPKCICESSSFIEAISCCVAGACDKNDQDATLTYARNICNPAGVSNLPSSAGCASTASASGSSTSTASDASSSASDASSSASEAASSAAESASSVASSASEAANSVASSASAAATSAAGSGAASGGHAGSGVLGAVGAGLLGVAALI